MNNLRLNHAAFGSGLFNVANASERPERFEFFLQKRARRIIDFERDHLRRQTGSDRGDRFLVQRGDR